MANEPYSTRSAPPPARRRRPSWVRGPRRDRSIQIGLIGTVIVHLLLLWVAPLVQEHFMVDAAALAAANRERDPYQLFDIQMVDEIEPPPNQFVEVNPDAPENKPDDTTNFGAQDQQLAQPEPADEEGDMPATEGDEEIDNTAIVTGSREEFVAPTPPAPTTPPEEQTDSQEEAAEAALAQNPFAGEEVIEGDSADGFATNIAERSPDATDVPDPIEGISDPEQASPNGANPYYRPNPSQPAPRPVLSTAQNRPTFLANRVNGTSRMGVVAHNALKTIYGEYLERVIEIVDQQWNNDIRAKIQRRLGFPLDGSHVQVKFELHKDGKVTIMKVEGNAGQLWNGTAVEAVAAPSRYSEGYGVWSDEMIVVLGESTEITFTFHY